MAAEQPRDPNDPMYRSPYDVLAAEYRNRGRAGIPVVEAVQTGNHDDYLAHVESDDRRPVGARTVIIADEQGGESATFVMRPNDPIVAAVANKYARYMSNQNLGTDERRAYQLKIVAEIADAKRAEAAAEAAALAPKPTPQPQALPDFGVPVATTEIPVPPDPQRNKIGVTFAIPGFGTHRALYDHVQLSDITLLLATRIDDAGGYYTPPPGPIGVAVDGMPATVTVVHVDSYRFNGYTHVVLIVNRDDDAS